MTRESLQTSIKEIVEEFGYTFYTGSDGQIAQQVSTLPFAWLAPLSIEGVEGHRDCRVYYRVRVRLVKPAAFDSHNEQQTLWQSMECDALALYHTLADDERIESVGNFCCTPSAQSITRCGDRSVTAEMEVKMFYCI